MVSRQGIDYVFEPDDRQLARRVAALQPDVVHVHGLGFTRLLIQIRRAVGARVPILMQHHGEQPPSGARSLLAQRITRRFVSGYLFTGGAAQAEPFREAGVVNPSAPVYEVLESASNLDDDQVGDLPDLVGNPCILWVGRLIASKDPLGAVRAIGTARQLGSEGHLHMLATDRSMEPAVRQLIDAMDLGEIVHIHQPVAFADMTGWYRRADTYFSTSHREAANYSLIEALGLGCRPVVTEIPSHAAIVKQLARRFAAGDSDEAGALLATPSTVRREQIIDHSQQNLSWANVAEQLVHAYRRSLRS